MSLLAQSADMGLDWLAPWANAGVVGLACGIMAWHFYRSPRLESEKVKADREWQSQCEDRRDRNEKELRDWHGEQVGILTEGVKELSTSVRTLADNVKELPCRHTGPMAFHGAPLPSPVRPPGPSPVS